MERSSCSNTPGAGVAPTPAPPPLQQREGPLDSAEILRGRRLVEIVHNGEVYRLQATRLGKLILTK